MREILFRGKRKDNGEWVYGGIEQSKLVTLIYDMDLPYCNQVSVIPETIGQYTGMTDNNWIKIYEGDILQNVNNPLVDKIPFKVEWNEHCGAWFWCSLIGEFSDFLGADHLYQHIAKNSEVIGNIHDSLN